MNHLTEAEHQALLEAAAERDRLKELLSRSKLVVADAMELADCYANLLVSGGCAESKRAELEALLTAAAGVTEPCARRLPAEPSWWAAALNRRATVEQQMFDASRGKRPMPTAEELRAWAMKLGTRAEGEPAPLAQQAAGDRCWKHAGYSAPCPRCAAGVEADRGGEHG